MRAGGAIVIMMCTKPAVPVITAAIFLTVAGAPPALPSPVIAPRMGFAMGTSWLSSDPTEMTKDLSGIAATGARWVRIGLNWSSVERQRGELRWSAYDRAVGLARRLGLDVIITVAYTPTWARAPGCDSQFCPPASEASFAGFVGAAVHRYRDAGVHTWE